MLIYRSAEGRHLFTMAWSIFYQFQPVGNLYGANLTENGYWNSYAEQVLMCHYWNHLEHTLKYRQTCWSAVFLNVLWAWETQVSHIIWIANKHAYSLSIFVPQARFSEGCLSSILIISHRKDFVFCRICWTCGLYEKSFKNLKNWEDYKAGRLDMPNASREQLDQSSMKQMQSQLWDSRGY